MRSRSPKIAVLAAVAILGILACGGSEETPAATVRSYFQALGRDPARALPLLTDAFHARHGLTVPSLEGWAWGDYKHIEPVERVDPDLAPIGAARGIESSQAAWLLVQAAAIFQHTAASLRYSIEDERSSELEARVRTRVQIPPENAWLRSKPFVETFKLVRSSPDAPWQIDEIVQKGVKDRALYGAFVAHPTEAAWQAVREHIPDAIRPKRDR